LGASTHKRYGFGMTIRFVDPRGVPSRPVDPYVLSLDREGPRTVGLLANNFPDSVTFLDELEAVMHNSFPTITTRRYAKPNASEVASEQLMATIMSECDGLITAYGH
jgi:hypothetical protein